MTSILSISNRSINDINNNEVNISGKNFGEQNISRGKIDINFQKDHQNKTKSIKLDKIKAQTKLIQSEITDKARKLIKTHPNICITAIAFATVSAACFLYKKASNSNAKSSNIISCGLQIADIFTPNLLKKANVMVNQNTQENNTQTTIVEEEKTTERKIVTPENPNKDQNDESTTNQVTTPQEQIIEITTHKKRTQTTTKRQTTKKPAHRGEIEGTKKSKENIKEENIKLALELVLDSSKTTPAEKEQINSLKETVRNQAIREELNNLKAGMVSRSSIEQIKNKLIEKANAQGAKQKRRV